MTVLLEKDADTESIQAEIAARKAQEAENAMAQESEPQAESEMDSEAAETTEAETAEPTATNKEE